MAGKKVVVVDDQREVRRLLTELFNERNKPVLGFDNGDDACDFVGEHIAQVELIVLDLDLGPKQRGGLEICQELRSLSQDIPIIILTGSGTTDDAVSALQAGATDFILKDPYLEDRLELSVEKLERMMAHAERVRELEGENRALRDTNRRLEELAGQRWKIVGESLVLQSVLDKVAKVAKVPRPVFIFGERGTGKELVARAIHTLSPRSSEAYITMNCAAIPESLLESEVFGHEEGAFTGATRQKEGKFELADGGTLFLDEIGNMSIDFQAKILRVIEYQRFERVAGSESIQVDVRMIAATNSDLQEQMESGTFRRDLYDRLSFEVIELPPLRNRKEDILPLAEHFLERFRQEVGGLRVNGFSKDAVTTLSGYSFPGNVRELKNVVERAVYSCEGAMVQAKDIEQALPSGESIRGKKTEETMPVYDDLTMSLLERVEAFEKSACEVALRKAKFSQKEAAVILGVSYDQFRQRYRKYGLGKEETEE